MRRIPLVLIVVALAATACAGGAPPRTDGSLLPEDRLELPQYDLETFRALLTELRGTPVVVNILGSWCPPCVEEAPDLAEISHEYEGQVQFVGIDILDQRDPARAFILRYDWPYPSIFDPAAAIRDGLGYIGQPITILYDRSGEVAWEWSGIVDPGTLRREIERVL
jgi:thiol-disulfide isomerase/thioredoxin